MEGGREARNTGKRWIGDYRLGLLGSTIQIRRRWVKNLRLVELKECPPRSGGNTIIALRPRSRSRGETLVINEVEVKKEKTTSLRTGLQQYLVYGGDTDTGRRTTRAPISRGKAGNRTQKPGVNKGSSVADEI